MKKVMCKIGIFCFGIANSEVAGLEPFCFSLYCTSIADSAIAATAMNRNRKVK